MKGHIFEQEHCEKKKDQILQNYPFMVPFLGVL